MDVKYQVFVSSTYTDLRDERRKVTEAILNLGHIPIGMEAFQASDDTQWEYIKRRIDESDYYIVIVAERYGSEKGGKSYTQMEYEYAVSKGVPVAAFLLETSARKGWPSDLVEFEKKPKVEKFRKLCEKKLCKHWINKDELSGLVMAALYQLFREKPRTGWVRASELPSRSVLNELAALSEEKRVLQELVTALSENERLKIPDTAHWRLQHLSKTTVGELMDYTPIEGEPSLLEHFEYAAPLLIDGCEIQDMKEQLEAISNIAYDEDAAEGFLRELMTNNLVAAQTFYPNGTTPIRTYQMSDYGREFIMFFKEWKSREDIKGLACQNL